MIQLEGAGRKPLVGPAFRMRGREVLWVERVFGRLNLLVPTEELVAFGLELILFSFSHGCVFAPARPWRPVRNDSSNFLLLDLFSYYPI
jgi:hypothetical protein